MPIPSHTRTVKLADQTATVEAVMNNCSDLWTATVTVGNRLLGTAAGTTPESAMANAIAAADRQRQRTPADV
jgi:hypothetical protein